MDLSKMTNEEARAVVAHAQNVFDASIADQQRSSPKEIQSLPLDLSVARTRSDAMKVSFPFKSVLVEQATDLNTYVYLIPISNDSGNDPIKLGLKDVYKSEYGFRECYIYWDAQPSKVVILKFFVRSIIENGRLVLDTNTNNNVVNLAGFGSQDNGFTYIFRAYVGTAAALDFISMGEVFPNDGFSITYDFFKRGIKVPLGYTCRLLAVKTTVNTTVTTSNGGGASFLLRMSKTDQTTDVESLWTYSFRTSAVFTAGAITEIPMFASNGLPPDRRMASIQVEQGTNIFLQKANSQSITAGNFYIDILVRFEPIVGGN